MRKRVVLLTSAFISVLPFSGLRCLMYRVLLGYEIRKSRIGWGTMIWVEKASIINSTIGRRNVFRGRMTVKINGARIAIRNEFKCGNFASAPGGGKVTYSRLLEIEEDCLITSGHFFDVSGHFMLGSGSWIAGCGSQFWTHGAGSNETWVRIGRGCYIGSAVRFVPGSGTGDNVIVGVGSVVTKAFDISNAMLGGVPAKVLRERFDWRSGRDIEENET